MIVFAGSFLSIAVFYLATNRRARKLSENAEDLHGSARWQSEEDVKNTGLLESSQGVYVGGWQGESDSAIRYLRHNGPEHVLAFAPTRSGKGVGLVIPTLLAWSESAIIYDIKGENWAREPQVSGKNPVTSASSSHRLSRTPVQDSIRLPRSDCSHPAMSATHRTSQ